MKTFTFNATEFPNASEAVQFASAVGVKAITCDGRNFATRESEAERLAKAGIEFAFLCELTMPNGDLRIVTVPIN